MMILKYFETTQETIINMCSFSNYVYNICI
jgi:hypothetical protein